MSEPKLTEPYQIKLRDLLSRLPPYGGDGEGQTKEVMSMLPGSPTLTSATGFSKAEFDKIKDSILSNQLFTDLTNYKHVDLLVKWRADRTTTCNEFCGVCATKMGYKPTGKYDTVGRFDIADILTQNGLGHCWARPQTGATPEYGDIFRLLGDAPDHNGVRLNHMGVSLYVEGKNWFTAESGQGGPTKGYDAVKRKRRDWVPASLQGWVSVRALLNGGQRVPNWLGGWWIIEEGAYDTYYYNFAAGGKVTCCTFEPSHPSMQAPAGALVGTFTMKGMYGVEIRWQSADVDETLQSGTVIAGSRKFTLTGKTKNGTVIKGERMMLQGVL